MSRPIIATTTVLTDTLEIQMSVWLGEEDAPDGPVLASVFYGDIDCEFGLMGVARRVDGVAKVMFERVREWSL